MFEGLRKKFSGFVEGLSKKEEQKEEQKEEEAPVMVQQQPQPSGPEPVQKDGQVAEAGQKSGKKITAGRKAPDVSIATKIRGTFLGRVRISEGDAEPFLDQLRLALLQSDVNYDVAERMIGELHSGLVGKELESRRLKQGISEEIRNTLMQVMAKNAGKDVVNMARAKKESGDRPFKILFLGPNGAGKTTTIAKIAYMLKSNGLSCAISASDTFRAAAIEQAAVHAKALGIPVVKGAYGADPASIAFDSVAYARAHGIDAVLIDSAGRQETNKSLIDELRKMVRVNKPDMCVFIGESIAGNSLLEQVKQFDSAARLDGIILTKLDVDSKGGNTLSILSDTSIPVLYFGTGEKYTDLIPYSAKFIVDSIMPNN